MCYTSGPLCSEYAAAWVEHTRKRVSQARSFDSRQAAESDLAKYQKQYDGTPQGQEELSVLARNGDIDAQARLLAGQEYRALWFAENKREDKGDVDEAHIPLNEDTNPALSLPLPEPIGRVYRIPDAPDLRRGPNGGVILPDEETIKKNILEGQWVPSITNVLGVRNSPHLVNWAASKGVKALNDMMKRSPQKVTSNPDGALLYATLAAERDRDAAAVQGTKIHYACEQISQGRSILPSYLSNEQWKFVEQFRAWMEKYQPKFIAREVTVFGETPYGKYAGTADFIAEIDGLVVAGDYKTTRSGLHIDVAFQLSAIAHASHYTIDGKTLLPMMKIDAGVGLLLAADKYEMRQAQIRGRSWDIFQGLRSAWVTHVLHGTQDDGSATLSEPLTEANSLVANW